MKLALAPLALALVVASGAARTAGGKSDLEQWDRGPVRYLLSRREAKEFRSLDTDAERALFVRDFWLTRDPDPRTPENEARMVFWQRVAEATHSFTDTTTPGWLTDRGRIYILLGPPNDIERDLDFQGKTAEGDYRGLLRWHYQGKVATGQSEPTFVVAFKSDETGDWRLTNDAILNSVYFDPLGARNLQGGPQPASRFRSILTGSQTDMGTALDLARITTPPGDDVALIDTVVVEGFYGSVPLALRWDFYPGPGDGRTLAVVSAFVARSDLSSPAPGIDPRPILLGRIEPAGGTRVDIGEGDFSPWEENAAAGIGRTLVYQARNLLTPGTAKVYVGIFDPVSYRAGKDERELQVPAFPEDRISISPITPARMLSPVTRKADQGYALPFVLGDLRVLPRENATFLASEDFAVYFQLVSPRDVPASQLELRFYRVTGDGLIPAGAPQVLASPQPVQGWTFPLKGWPAGSYRLVVTAKPAPGPAGTLAGVPVTQTFDFEIKTS